MKGKEDMPPPTPNKKERGGKIRNGEQGRPAYSFRKGEMRCPSWHVSAEQLLTWIPIHSTQESWQDLVYPPHLQDLTGSTEEPRWD